ncbi:MAG: archease [Dehalococcoidia bacterium]
MKGGFQLLEHTADVGLVARGADLKQAFAAAATGLFSIIAQPRRVQARECRHIEVEAGDKEALLVEWLNELIYLFDAHHMLFKRFDMVELTPTRLVAEAWGEPVDPSRHRIKMGVKAATYHMLQVEREGDGYRLQVLFDV